MFSPDRRIPVRIDFQQNGGQVRFLVPCFLFTQSSQWNSRLARSGRNIMKIWVDADACPGEVKELLFRAAERTKTALTLVANQPMRVPHSELIDSIRVGPGANVADQKIVKLAEPGDLVITADIPLAADAIEKGAEALNPRGELYTATNIGERLAARNLLDELRGEGQITGGPSNYGVKDKQTFANQLDRWLTAAQRRT